MLKDRSYAYTSADVLFESNVRHEGVSEPELRSRRRELWDEFFARPQPCLRASALPKKFGWGIHCDADGKVALCPMESAQYHRLARGTAGVVTVLHAFRSSRR
jgi:hypothetical protein